jgi:hypothetical protein
MDYSYPGYSNGLGGFSYTVSSTSDVSPKSPIPAQQPPLPASALQTCSGSCAHISALTPSGTFGPGECIENVTYDQLKKYNLIVLMILAAETDAQFSAVQHCTPYFDLEPLRASYLEHLLEGGLKDPPRASYLGNCSNISPRPEREEQEWTPIIFECLQKVLLYQKASPHESTQPGVVWILEDLVTDTVWNTPKYKKITISESSFIRKLLDIPDAALDPSHPPNSALVTSPTVDALITRRHSAPDLRASATAISPSITQKITSWAQPPNVEPLCGALPSLHEKTPISSLLNLRQGQITKAAPPADSSHLADLVRSGLAKRASEDLVQTVSSVTGTVAGVVGSIGTVVTGYLLWKQHRQRSGPRTQDDDTELAMLTPSGDGPETVGDSGIAEAGESIGGNSHTTRVVTENATSDNTGNPRNPGEGLQLTANSVKASSRSELLSDHYSGQQERTPRDHISRDVRLQDWVNTTFLWLYQMDEYPMCNQEFHECIRIKYEEVLVRQLDLVGQVGKESALRTNAEKQEREWKRLAERASKIGDGWQTLVGVIETNRDDWKKRTEVAKTEIAEWEKQSTVVKARKDECERQAEALEAERDEWEMQARAARAEKGEWEMQVAAARAERDEWELQAGAAETERDEWERQARVAKAERDEFKMQAKAAKAERDELLSHVTTNLGALERLQKMRLKFVFQDLVITVREKRFNEWVQEERIKLISQEKDLSRAEAKRQEHNRKTAETFQKESLQTRQHLETETRKLQSARTVLVTDQAVLAQAQQAYATKNAALHGEINTLEAAIHAQESKFARKKEALEFATKKIAERERVTKNAEVRANKRMLQRKLELARQEDALAEREKAMHRG